NRRADPGAATLVDVARRLDELLPDDAVVACDAGDFSGPFAVHLRLRGDRRFLGPTSGCMGYGLPAAIGAMTAQPDRSVVAICGDGGVMMAIQELETAVRYGLPVVVVVCNNNLHGSIARHQRARFGGRLVGTRLGSPAFADLARAFGAKGWSVSDADGFADAFKLALDSDVPTVIEVRM
ncbi:MAG: thiamine pyrophosphate-dependent enzyme, partial [Nocardioidaceae bacterium]